MRSDSLTFRDIGSTKMFCAATNDLERAFLDVLTSAATYQLTDSTLTLRTKDAREARFKPAAK